VYRGSDVIAPLHGDYTDTVSAAMSPRLRGLALFWALVILLVAVSLGECTRYRAKFVAFERARNKGGLAARLEPLRPDADLASRPLRHDGFCPWRCGVFLSRELCERCAVVSALCFKRSLCRAAIFPGRLERVAYAAAVVSLALAICGVFAIAGGGPFPRGWATGLCRAVGPLSEPHQVVIIETNTTTITFSDTNAATIDGTRIVVDGVADGVWAAAMALPAAMLLSLCLAKRGAYADIVRLLAPVRYRATMGAVRRAMESRGLPVREWIKAARHPDNAVDDPLYDAPPKMQIAPGKDWEVNNPIFIPGDLTSDPTDRAREAFFDGGYLEMSPADERDLRSHVEFDPDRPAAPDALGWGVDSVMGDVAVSGAREAIPIEPDADSLMEWHGDKEFEGDFSPKVEELVWRWVWWRMAAKTLAFVYIGGGLASSVYFLFYTDDVTRDERDRFYTGVVVCIILLLVVYSLAMSLLMSCVKAWPREQSRDSDVVGIPSCRTLWFSRMVY